MNELTLKQKFAAIYLLISMVVGSSVICYTVIMAVWHLTIGVARGINKRRSIMEPSSESN